MDASSDGLPCAVATPGSIAARRPPVTTATTNRFFTKHSPSPPGRSYGVAAEAAARNDRDSQSYSTEVLDVRTRGCTGARRRSDRLTLARIARIARERQAATAKYLRDRDTDALEAAMTRLDEEEREASEEKVEDGVPAAEAVRYLKELGRTWSAADGGKGRKMLAEALFERIEVRGFREARLHLTDAAIAHGFGTVLPERLRISVSGRGERI